MTSLHDIWDQLFEEAPSAGEEMLMQNLSRLVDPDDASFIMCALVVRFLYQVLLLDPASPINLAGRAGQALKDIDIRAAQLDRDLKELKSSAFWTLDALREARKFSEERRKLPPPVLELNPLFGSPYWEHSLAPNALWKIGAICLIATAFGGAFLLMLILAAL